MKCRQGNSDEVENYLSKLHDVVHTKTLSADALCAYQWAVAAYWIDREDFGAAQQALEEGLQNLEYLSAPSRVISHEWLAVCMYRQGLYGKAVETFYKALEDINRHNSQHDWCFIQVQWSNLEMSQMDIKSPTKRLSSIRELLYSFKDNLVSALMQLSYSRLHTLRGDLPAAHTALTEAIDLFERMGMRRELAEAREELARLEAQMAEEN